MKHVLRIVVIACLTTVSSSLVAKKPATTSDYVQLIAGVGVTVASAYGSYSCLKKALSTNNLALRRRYKLYCGACAGFCALGGAFSI